MKVTRNTPEQLILEKKSWGVGGMLIVMMMASVVLGAVFIGIGLTSETLIFTVMGALAPVLTITLCAYAMRSFVERLQLILDRHAGTLTLRTQKLKDYTEVIHDLDHFAGAKLDRHTDSERNRTSRVVLILSDGPSAGDHPVSNVFVSGWGPKKAVETINAWHANAAG